MGDKKNALKKLQLSIKSVKYTANMDLNELSLGSPKEYLKLYHYLFLSYSPLIANEILNKHQLELNSKNDKAFIDGVYKLLRDMFNYVPKLNRDQFFTTSYAQIKALMACDVIDLIKQKLKTLQPTGAGVVSSSTSNNGTTIISALNLHTTANLNTNTHLSQVGNGNSSARYLIKNNNKQDSCTGGEINENNDSPRPTKLKYSMSIHNHMTGSASSSSSSNKTQRNHKDVAVLKEQNVNSKPQNEELNQAILSLKASSEAFNSNILEKIDALNNRLNAIETAINTQKINNESVDEFVKINKKDYENILARLTVLETEILMGKQNGGRYTERQDIDQDITNYETPSHSFYDTNNHFNNDLENSLLHYGGSGSKGIVCQGMAVDFDKLRINDQSMHSNETTPTMISCTKESKFIGHELKMPSLDSINRAKDLILRATLVNQDLTAKLK